MAAASMAPIASRPLRLASYCLVALLVVTSAGCRNRRAAMRPVYVEPGLPPVTSIGVDSSPVLIDEAAPSKSMPMMDDPDLNPRLAPINPQAGSNLRPSRDPSPPPADEPGLQLERTPKALISPPDLTAPKSTSNAPQTRSVSRSRQVALQDRVRPFVNDPDDLFQPPKADRPWKYVVVHHSANATGSYDQIDREHRKIQGWDGCGYHFVIGNGSGSPDGQIEVARRWSNQKHGLHCRNGKNPDVNEYGIGICLIGNLDEAPPTPKQIAASKALVAYLSQRYQIPGDQVGTHAELAGTATACPGKNFPEEQIFGSKHVASK